MRTNVDKMVKVIGLLSNQDLSVVRLAKRAGVQTATARKWVEALHKATPKIVYVCDWEDSEENGRPMAVYSWGNFRDATRPPKLTDADRQQRRRNKKAAAQIALALRPDMGYPGAAARAVATEEGEIA